MQNHRPINPTYTYRQLSSSFFNKSQQLQMKQESMLSECSLCCLKDEDSQLSEMSRKKKKKKRNNSVHFNYDQLATQRKFNYIHNQDVIKQENQQIGFANLQWQNSRNKKRQYNAQYGLKVSNDKISLSKIKAQHQQLVCRKKINTEHHAQNIKNNQMYKQCLTDRIIKKPYHQVNPVGLKSPRISENLKDEKNERFIKLKIRKKMLEEEINKLDLEINKIEWQYSEHLSELKEIKKELTEQLKDIT